MAKTFGSPKDPQEIRDYGVDWTEDIGAVTIVSSIWTVVAGTVVIDSDIFDDTTATARLSGGTLGETCQLLNHIELSNGEETEVTCRLRIRAK